MKIPTFKRLFKQDYPAEQQPMIEKLSYSVNTGFDSIISALTRNLTFNDNFNSEIKTFDIITDSAGTPTNTVSFSTIINGNVAGIIVLRAINKTNTTSYPNATPFITYTQNNNNLTVSNITGLTAKDTYSITILMVGS